MIEREKRVGQSKAERRAKTYLKLDKGLVQVSLESLDFVLVLVHLLLSLVLVNREIQAELLQSFDGSLRLES